MSPRAAGLLLGFAADRWLGDPHRFHPVAGFGWLATRLEQVTYGDNRMRGVIHVSLLAGGTTLLGGAIERLVPGPIARTALMTVSTWVVLGGRSLEREAIAVHDQLLAGDLPAARRQVNRLVGRDTDQLDPSEVARAAVESVAENTSDAVVAPLVWGSLLGPAGVLGYRAVNTLDAMIGHRTSRYENFGWVAARLDDLVNLPGSRLTGLLVLMSTPENACAAWQAWQRDASRHPSPNAGVVEATFSGALGIRLGGTNRYYGNRIEHRAVMGNGRSAEPRDIAAATRLARRVDHAAVVIAFLTSARS